MSGTLLVVLAITGLVVYYASSCWLWPYTACSRCKGTGRHKALWGGSAFRLCGRCDGTGRRLRTGRRIFNFFWNRRKDR
jgi:hypothetical protein